MRVAILDRGHEAEKGVTDNLTYEVFVWGIVALNVLSRFNGGDAAKLKRPI